MTTPGPRRTRSVERAEGRPTDPAVVGRLKILQEDYEASESRLRRLAPRIERGCDYLPGRGPCMGSRAPPIMDYVLRISY